MWSLLALHKIGQGLVLVIVVILVVVLLGGHYYHAPAGVKNLPPRGFELHGIHLAHHGGIRHFTVRIENGNEVAAHLVIYQSFLLRKVLWHNACRNDGVVVGDLRTVENLLAFGQFLPHQRGGEGCVGNQSLQNLRTFRVDIVAEVGGIHARIGGEFLFVKALDELQCLVGGKTVLFVAFHL